MATAPLRIGVLGAANITPMALLRPARQLGADVVVVAAVAARDVNRAQRFARRHGIAHIESDYAALIARDDLDAIYNPLPNSLHAHWTIAALARGKHVLCEKPMAANAVEAAAMVDAATDAGRVLMEAFHWRYHPLATAMTDAIARVGRRRRVRASFIVPFWIPGDIRYQRALAGGALMDTGCYAVHIARTCAGLVGRDVGIVVDHAEARLSKPIENGGVDRWFAGRFHAKDAPDCAIEIEAGLCSGKVFACRATVVGDDGTVDIWNPVAPQFGHLLRERTTTVRATRRIRGDSTYVHQLRAFIAACHSGDAPITDGVDGVRTMAVIDALTASAGLSPRPGG